jgi:flavin-binding protein dodecin
MALQVKVAELVGESSSGWRDAVKSAVKEAAKAGNQVTGVEVMNFTANVQNGDVVEYKANVKIAYADYGGEKRH